MQLSLFLQDVHDLDVIISSLIPRGSMKDLHFFKNTENGQKSQ